MPELEVIDRLKETINQLGNEPAILAEQGIELEDVTPPEPEQDDELQAMLEEEDFEIESTNLEERIAQGDKEESDPFADLDASPEMGFADSLDIPEEEIKEDLTEEDFSTDFELPETEESEDLPTDEAPMEDISIEELTMEAPEEIAEPPADESSFEEVESLDDITGFDELEDLAATDDFGSLDEVAEAGEEEPAEEIPEEIEDLAETEGPITEETPDIALTLDNLSEELEVAEASGEMSEDLSMEEDFGLNEIGDDFLDDLEEDESGGSFSLDDLGEEFRLTEEDESSSDLGLDLDSLEKSIDEAEVEEHEEEFELTSDEMARLKEALYYLPRNLKLAVEELLSDPETPVDELNRVVELLLKKAPIKNIASKVSKIRGRRIEIPRGYQKLNVQEYQREQESPVTQFREKVMPRVLTGLLAFFALWVIFLLSFNFIYRPLKARSLYTKGMNLIALDEYDQGEYYFRQAYEGWNIGNFSVKGWPKKDWFYSYARNYVDRRKYDRAALKYRDLLKVYPSEKEARLEYAQLLTEKMARFEEAIKILQMANPIHLELVDRGEMTYEDVPIWELAELKDYDLLIAIGDSYFLWGEVDPQRFEDARFTYAYIMEYISDRDEVALRMLRYFLKLNVSQEVERWIQVYKDRDRVYGDPRMQSEIFSELAGWLLDRRRHGEAELFLRKARDIDSSLPDIHYQYARYFNVMHNRSGEREALTSALGYLIAQESSRKKYLLMKLDCYKRLAEYMQAMGDVSQAEKNYLLAIAIYEDAHSRNLIGPSQEIGALYSQIGDLNYRVHRNYDVALEYYKNALENFYDLPEVHYRMGYIYYTHRKDYDRALLEFYRSSRALPNDRNVIFAMANTLFQKEDYFSSLSYYERLITQLEEEEQNIGILLPDQKEEHYSLQVQLMKVYNNLGAAQYKAAERSPNRGLVSQALSQFTFSSEYYDRLTRNRDNLVRSDISGLAYDNRRTVLRDEDMAPQDGRDVVIYQDLISEMDGIVLNY